MKLIDSLERRFGWIAIPNLIIYLVIGQVLVWAMRTFLNYPMDAISLVPLLVAQGEVWRLFTFAFFPPEMHPLFLIFAWYILFMMGNALEHYWGSFRFTLYVLSGLLFSVVAAGIALFLYPNVVISNIFISSSIFLAFAFLNPDYEFLLFFILPVKVKWLAMLTWILLLVSFLSSPLIGKVIILAGVGNFFLFFGKDVVQMFRNFGSRTQRRAKAKAAKPSEEEPFHVCSVCGTTDLKEPELHFVYKDGVGICERCIEKEKNSD